MNFVLTFFIYDDLKTMMVSLFGETGIFSSPFWITAITAEGAATYLEDRTLHTELAGYPEYAQKTRYRLIPGIW